MRSIQAELMDEENIACEAESELIWMQVAGLPSEYSLRLILNTGVVVKAIGRLKRFPI